LAETGRYVPLIESDARLASTTGSACHSGSIELSPVLDAMGIAPEIGMSAVRFSIGRWTTREEIDPVMEQLTDALATVG
jgi:cysteine desulfurase